MSNFQRYYNMVCEGIGGDFDDPKVKKIAARIMKDLNDGIRERKSAGIELENLDGSITYGLDISADDYFAMKSNKELRDKIFIEIKRKIGKPNAVIKLKQVDDEHYVDVKYRK